ncbi:hypothetical protein [Aurantiacibacter luteus]|uniref:Lipoprotein n=1 Tax=Aurantiacibacter luteus TaxID=1581420 RepID=A0A0G9N2G4_9SPHN|nr:hypothetical protein [Aurantiacibacter luteus]KLE35723.1 hypothetical protein AAW00_04850 [Aurantiacibacter luteus]
MRRLPLLAALLLAGCVTEAPLPPDAGGPVGQLDPADVERIVFEAARDRYGAALVREARDAREHVIAFRAHGGIPVPPPPGEPFPPPPAPSMALMMKRGGQWLVAETGTWRQARSANVAEMLAIAASADFRAEPVHVPPCPDYGAVRLVAQLDGLSGVARDHGCPSRTDRFVSAALGA